MVPVKTVFNLPPQTSLATLQLTLEWTNRRKKKEEYEIIEQEKKKQTDKKFTTVICCYYWNCFWSFDKQNHVFLFYKK